MPKKEHLREVLLHHFLAKKNAAETHKILLEVYGENALSETQCREWFRRFKSGDFDLSNKERGRPEKKFEDTDLQAILDEDATLSEKMMAQMLNVTQQTISNRLRAMGKIQKEGKWVPHKLTDRQMQNRKTICEILLARQKRKGFLHRIVTGDEKWIYYDNPKRKKSWVDPGQPSTSQPKRNIHGHKTMLCIWWDQKGVVYYELLKPGQTVTAALYQQQLIQLSRAFHEKRTEIEERHERLILLHDNARPHVAKPVQETLEALRWEVLPHAAYSPDKAPSDYHLFRSMAHGLADQSFNSFEDVKKWVDEWIASKDESFFRRGIRMLPERWEKIIANDGYYFD